MKKAYVMKSFDGYGEPMLDLIMDSNGNVVNNREDALLVAESFAEMFSTKVTDVLVFEIKAKDASIYDALEYTENQVIGLFRNNTRIIHGNILHVGRTAVDAGNIAVCGNPGFSFEVMGIGETTEKSLREAWSIAGYEEEYTGSEEQLDRLNSDCAISAATISQAAENLVRDGYHDLDESYLIFHQTYKGRYEICTREEYIHALMTEYDSNFNEWQEG